MAHLNGLPDDSTDDARRILRDKRVHAARPMRERPRKPSNWWAFEREPWKRVKADILAREKAGAERERADRALRSAFAFAGAALAMANGPAALAVVKAPLLVPGDRE